MTIMAIIRAALEALIAYFNLKREQLGYELVEASERRMRDIRVRIDALRDKGNEAATQEADLLFAAYQREKLKYEKYLNSL
jgi:hypothetical protein